MPVTVTITLTDEQEAYARSLVSAGGFEDIDGVVGVGLEQMRQRHGTHPPDEDSLRRLLAERMKGPFIPVEEFTQEMETMLAEEMASRDVSG